MTQEYTARTGHTVVGVFDGVAQAEQAINDLKVAGFTPDSISVVTKDRSINVPEGVDTGNEAAQGALVGSLGGGTLGAVLGWLLAGGTALIPGIGPVIAAGVFGATAAGALIGGTLGGITGALAGSGVPEDEAAEYEEHVRGGRTLVTVSAANGHQLEAATNIFDRNDATGTRYYDVAQPGPGRTYVPGEVAAVRDINNQDIDNTPGGYKVDPLSTHTVTQPGKDPGTFNQSIYAQGHSDIAPPDEFDRRVERTREQAEAERLQSEREGVREHLDSDRDGLRDQSFTSQGGTRAADFATDENRERYGDQNRSNPYMGPDQNIPPQKSI